MKKILLLLILIPFSALAKYHSGVITFNDNTIKKGFIEIPDDSENNKIKFRLEEKGDTEKYPIELVKSFIIMDNKGQTSKFTITHLAYFNGFSKENEFRSHKKLACVRVIKEGKINLYSAWFMTAGAGKGAVGGATITESFTSYGNFYVNRPGDDYSLELYEGNPGGANLSINSFKYFKTMVEKHFGKECPNLVNLIDKDDFKKNGVERIVELYEQNCGIK